MGLSSLGFYVTVGRGTEDFAKGEISNTFSGHGEAEEAQSSQVDFAQVRDGKVIFKIPGSTNCYLTRILSLKCVERAFVAITDYENITKGKRDFLDRLMQTMSSTHSFEAAIKVLDQLRSLSSRKRRVKDNVEQHQTDDVDEPLNKIARLNDDVDFCKPQSDLNQLSGSCDEMKDLDSGGVKDLDSGGAKDFDSGDDIVECITRPEYKTFRMSVRCSGKSRKWINVKKLSKDLSWRIARASDWIVDLRKPDFEICLHISDHYVTAGIPLTSKPLSRRPFISDPGLRGPIAWIMVQLAEIKPCDVVLDPMCGKGTLLLEACSIVKDACYIGADNDLSQIEVAQQNVTGIGYHKHINLFQGDGLCLPLKPSSVDTVICDAPFNQNHFTSKRPDEFYFSFLEEMYKILCHGGKFVLLTSQELSRMLIPLLETTKKNNTTSPSTTEPPSVCPDSDLTVKLDNNQDKKFSFELVSNHYMKLGETHAEIIVMIKL